MVVEPVCDGLCLQEKKLHLLKKKNISNHCPDDNDRDNDDYSGYNKTICDDGGYDGNDLSKESQTSALISLAK